MTNKTKHTPSRYRDAQIFVEGLSILHGKEFPTAAHHSNAMHEMKKSHDELLAVCLEATRVYEEKQQGGESYDRLCAAIARAEKA